MDSITSAAFLRKSVITYVYMYFIAPYIWGIWISFKLQIVTFTNFLHAITSPISIAFLGLMVLANKFIIKRYIQNLTKCNDKQVKQKGLAFVMRYHIISILFFGTVGTFLCMLILFLPNPGFFDAPADMSIRKAIIGSLSGAALTFMFFTMFIYMQVQRFAKYLNDIVIDFKPYFIVNLTLLVVGIILLFYSSDLAMNFRLNGIEPFNQLNPIKFRLSLLIPTLVGSFILTIWTLKTKKKLINQ